MNALLVLDEAVSNLDILLQGQIIDLIRSLRQALGMALLFITHDLRLVRLLCDRVAVMEAGRIVETGPVARSLHLQSREGRALQEAILPALPPGIDTGAKGPPEPIGTRGAEAVPAAWSPNQRHLRQGGWGQEIRQSRPRPTASRRDA